MDKPSETFWTEQAPQPWRSWWHALELAAVFAVGACLMNFLYAGTGGAMGDALGVPGHDSWYHVKMAVLLPEIGLVDEFPWLRFVYFRESGDEFVSHHYGFHTLLVPFVYAGKWMRGDFLCGGRWAISAFFAASLVMFQLILMTQRVRCRWLWLALYLLMPAQFFSRQAFVRAIAPSLLFMLLIVVLMFRRRYVLTGLAVAAYTHLYMGGVIFGPLIVICYALAGLIGPRGDRVSWRLWLWTLLGWAVAIRLHPYYAGMFEFLRLQVFGTGISADISVGTEWKPYEKVWWLTGACAGTLIPQVISICLRLRLGPRINAKELSVLLMSLAFAALMLKSRRFVEYWPPFGLLSAALLAGPLLEGGHQKMARWFRGLHDGWISLMPAVGLISVCAGVAAGLYYAREQLGIGPLLAEWRVWALVAGGGLLVPVARYWIESRPRSVARTRRGLDLLAIPMAGAIFVAALVSVCWLATGAKGFAAWRFLVPWWCFLLLAVVYLLVALLGRARTGGQPIRSTLRRLDGLAAITATGLLLFAGVLAAAGPQLVGLQRRIRAKWDLPAIPAAMAYLQEVSPAGSVVFTDDWDIFPVYFYTNSHNHYIVGLDPKFTQHRDPLLWDRYKAISRGQTPKTVKADQDDGTKREVRVEIEDIRTHFEADYVIVDSDHMPFRRKLDAAGSFCERVYPPTEPGASGTDSRGRRKHDDKVPYAIYRVFSADQQAAVAAKSSAQGERNKQRSPSSSQPTHTPASAPTTRPTTQPATSRPG